MKATNGSPLGLVMLATAFLALTAALTIKIVIDYPQTLSTNGGPQEKVPASGLTTQPTPEIVPPQSTLPSETQRAGTSSTRQKAGETSVNSSERDDEESTQAVNAEIRIEDKSHNLSLSAGNVPVFQRVYIQPQQQVDIRLEYPDSEPGDPIVIQVEDGGSLDDGKIARVAKLDANKSLAFAFKASRFEGIHRVRVWKGADQKMLDFWAGEPLPVAGN